MLNKKSKLYNIMQFDVGAFLNKDITGFLKHKNNGCNKKQSQGVRLNRSFLSGFMLVIFCIGFFGGIVFNTQIKSHTSKVIDVLAWYFPSLSHIGSITEDGVLSLQTEATSEQTQQESKYFPVVSQEQAVIDVVKSASPAVVSIVITKEVPVYETYYETYKDPFSDFFGGGVDIQVPKQRQNGTEKQKVGGGTGFIVSSDGLVLTNKHVVSDKDAIYTVITNDGRNYSATVLARDPFQDLAVLKIETSVNVDGKGQVVNESFPVVNLGNSSAIEIGQTVVAIGYALGEFRNTVSVGVISGVGRTITASGGGVSEVLTDVLQTDTAINKGNSGGPLLNLRGEVIGVNVAMAEGAQSIGFAIPSSKAKKAINDVKLYNKIVYAFLGVRHIEITPELKESENLPVNYGSLIAEGTAAEPGVSPNSGAATAGLKSGDIILEVNGIRVDSNNSLGDLIQKHHPGDTVSLKILRDGKELSKTALLGEISSEE